MTITTTEGMPNPGLIGRITGLWFSPRETFGAIVREPRLWVALLAFVVLFIIFTAVWTRNVDPLEYMKVQIEESGQLEKIPAEQRATVFESQAKMFPYFAWAGPFVFAPAMVFFIALVLWLVYRFGFSSPTTTYLTSAGIVAHVFVAVGVITTPLTLLVLYLKGDWSVDPRTVIGANLGLLLDKGTTASWLYSLASSIDLFSLWQVFLIAVGFSVATRRPTGSTFWGVAIPWILVVLAGAGWKAMFS